MFYSASEISKVIKCLTCKNTFITDPRMLPCGFTICDDCHSQLVNKQDEVKCELCNRSHPIPKEGFPINFSISQLIDIRPREIHRSRSVQKLQEKLQLISEEVDSLRCDLNNGIDTVKSHCSSLRNQVQVEVEVLINNIHELNEEFGKEIDAYEAECIANYELKKDPVVSASNKVINEANEFCRDQRQYLSEFKIEDEQIESTIDEADRCLTKLRTERSSVGQFKFGRKIMKFVPTDFKPHLFHLGELKMKKLGELRLDSLKVHCLSDMCANLNNFMEFNSDFFVFKTNIASSHCFYIDKNCKLNIVNFDDDGNVLGLKTNFVKSALNHFKVVYFGGKFLFYLRTPDQEKKMVLTAKTGEQIEMSSRYVLLVIDKNLKYLTHRELIMPLSHIAANLSTVFCFNIEQKWDLYTTDLKPLDQTFSIDVDTFDLVEVNENFMVTHFSDPCEVYVVSIVSLSTGEVLKQFSTGCFLQFKLVGEDYLMMIKIEVNELECYELLGDFKLANKFSLKLGSDLRQKLTKNAGQVVSFFQISLSQSNNMPICSGGSPDAEKRMFLFYS